MRTKRKPESAETNRKRQQQLRDRRKALGFKRVTVWLSPEQQDTLESFGGEPWLGTTVKLFLEQAVAECQRTPTKQAALFDIPEPAPVTAERLPENEQVAFWAEADSLNAGGMAWAAIARLWNDQGRRTTNGAEFRGNNVAREVRKWKQAGGKRG